MVKAIIDISKDANKILTIIKIREDLRTKSEAINWLAKHYTEKHKKAEVATRETPHVDHWRKLYG